MIIIAVVNVTMHAMICIQLLARLNPSKETATAYIICVINKKKYVKDIPTINSMKTGRKYMYRMIMTARNSIRNIYTGLLWIFVKYKHII